MKLVHRFRLECARRLPRLAPEHPCARLHGHTFQVELQVQGGLDPELGWVCDLADLRAAWQPIHAALDHRCLNDVPGLENPTSEHLAVWLWQRLQPALPGLAQVTVLETPDSGCIYHGPCEAQPRT